LTESGNWFRRLARAGVGWCDGVVGRVGLRGNSGVVLKVGVELGNVGEAGSFKEEIDEAGRPRDDGAVRQEQATQEDAAVALAIAEGEVEPFEGTAAVSRVDTVEVPAAVESLEGMAVAEGVWVLGGEPVEFDFLKAAGEAGDAEFGVEKKLSGNVMECVAGIGRVRKRWRGEEHGWRTSGGVLQRDVTGCGGGGGSRPHERSVHRSIPRVAKE
jgi:hypothetical protein